MRSESEIDADFRRLHESLRWINHSGNYRDKQWFDEAKNLLAADYDCEVIVKLLDDNRELIIAHLGDL